VRKQGDVDCNGVVSLVDALAIFKQAAAIAHGAGCMQQAGNTNCTGPINADDGMQIVLWKAGLPQNLPTNCPRINELT
jgi:hypothetical protein